MNNILTKFNTVKNKICFKSKLICAVLMMPFVFFSSSVFSAGIWDSYVMVNSTNYFLSGAHTNIAGAAAYDGTSLGTFAAGTTQTLNGAEDNTYRNSGSENMCGGTLYYRVYQINSTPGSFLTISLPYDGTYGNQGSNQQWKTTTAAINFLSGLTAGTYYLEVYMQSTGSNSSTSGCGDTYTINNSGSNFKGTFTVTGGVYWDFGPTTATTTASTNTSGCTLSAMSIGNILGGGPLASNPGTTSASTGYTGVSGTNNYGNAAATGALSTSTSAYFEFTVTPPTGAVVTLTAISFGARGTGTGPLSYTLRSSLDAYASDITTGTLLANSTWALKSNSGLTTASAAGTAITFRIFGYGGTGSPTNNTINWRVDDVNLTTTLTYPGALSASTGSFSFGSVNSGSQSASQTFNLSGAYLTGYPGNITVTAPSTDFQVSNDNSTWGSSTTIAFSAATLSATAVYVRFSPQSGGAKSGNLSFSGGGATVLPTVALSGTGIATTPTLAVSSGSLTFSTTQTVGTTTASQTFNLSGTFLTGAPSNITVTAPSTDFQVSNDNSTWGATTTIAYSSGTLAATAVYVRFSPQSTGAKSGNVTFTGGGTSSNPTVALTGTAVTGTLSTNGTTTFTFTSQAAGTQSASQTFNLSGANLINGSGSITVSAPSTDFQVSNNNSTWGATATVTYSSTTLAAIAVYVRFTPQTAGTKTGNVTFSGGGVASPPTIALTGAGSLTAPVATAGTSITGTGFNANWGTVTAASSGYLLDVSTSPTFGTTGTATANEGFETGMTMTSYATGTGSFTLGSGAWNFVNVIKGLTTNVNTGSVSCQMQGGTGATATSPTYNGIGTVTLYLKPGGSNTSVTVSKLIGGVTTLVQTISLTGGAAYAQYTVNVNDNSSAVQLVIGNGTAVVYLDDIAIGYNTSVPSFVTGYNALAVSGQSTITQAVSGLSPGTYYYRVRATDGTNTSANSNVITVTIQDPAVANYRSVTSGNYSTASTWQYDVTGAGNYIAATQAPGANNNTTIQSGHTVTLTGNQTINTSKTVTVNSGGVLNAASFNLNGAGNLTISSGGQLTSADANGITATSATGSVQVSGTRSYSSAGIYAFSAASGNTGNFFTVTTPTTNTVAGLTIAGNITYNSSTTAITTTTLTLTSGSFLLGSANTVNIANGGNIYGYGGSMASTGTGGNDGGTINFLNGASASIISYPTSSTASFYNITINGSNASGYNLGGASTTVNGALTINGSYVQSTTAPTYSSSSTLTYNTGGAYTAANEWTLNTGSGAGVPQNVSIIGAGTSINFGSATQYHQLNGNLSIGTGTFFALSTAAGGDVYIKGNWTRAATGSFTPNSSAANFIGSSAQTVSVTGGGTETFAYLLINNASNVQLSSSPATSITVSAGAFDALQLTNGSLDLNGQSLNMTTDGGNIKVTGARNIISSSAATINIQGNKTVTYASSGNTLTLASTITMILAGKYIDFGNPSSSNYTYINGTLQINNSGYVNNYAPYYNAGSTLVYNTTGSYSPNKEWYENTFSQPGVPYNVTLSNTSALNFNGHGYPFEMWGNLTIASGTSFALNTGGSPSPDLYIKGDWTNAGTFTPNGHLVRFYGTANQNINSGANFAYLEVANTAGVTINTDATASIQLKFTSGIITTGSNKVIVTSSSSTAVTGQSSANYINGNLRRYVANSTSYDFPVGTAINYELANLNLTAEIGMSYIDGYFTAGLPATMPNSNTCKINSTPITTMLNGGYWTMTPDNYTTALYDITLSQTGYTTPFRNADSLGVIKRHDATFAWAGTTRTGSDGLHSNTNSSVSGGIVTVKRTAIPTFSQYGIGVSGSFALPVKLIYFTAVNKDNNGLLTWATATEIDNDHFDIERSLDGISFEKIGQVAGHDNSSQTINYDFNDADLSSHNVNTIYYRLKQVDVDGKFEYTAIVSVDVTNVEHHFHVISTYPNPFSDHFNVSFFNPASQPVRMSVYDIRGALVSEETIEATEGMNVYSIPNAPRLASGFYTMNITLGNTTVGIKMLKGE